jgi:hypothetical protein
VFYHAFKKSFWAQNTLRDILIVNPHFLTHSYFVVNLNEDIDITGYLDILRGPYTNSFDRDYNFDIGFQIGSRYINYLQLNVQNKHDEEIIDNCLIEFIKKIQPFYKEKVAYRLMSEYTICNSSKLGNLFAHPKTQKYDLFEWFIITTKESPKYIIEVDFFQY